MNRGINMYVSTCEICEAKFFTKSLFKKYCSEACKRIAKELKEMESEQLCWRCRNACGGCSWSREFKPVEGWDAKPTIINGDGEEIPSFEIKKCPMFIKD